jgi:hypothetical protein
MNTAGIESIILEQVQTSGPCTLENLLHALPDLSWNQVFSAVDHLSREGQLTLRQPTRFEYMVSVGSTQLSAPRIHGINSKRM